MSSLFNVVQARWSVLFTFADRRLAGLIARTIKSLVKEVADAVDLSDYGPRLYMPRESLDLLEARIANITFATLSGALEKEAMGEIARLIQSGIRAIAGVLPSGLGRGGGQRLIAEAIAERTRVNLGDVMIRGVSFNEVLRRLANDAANQVVMPLRESWGGAFTAALYEGLGTGEAMLRAAQAAGLGVVTKRDVADVFGPRFVKRLKRATTDYMAAALDQRTIELYRANSDAVVGVQWVSTLDRKTCPRCAALDGQRWFWDADGAANIEKTPQIPLHPNCRCTRIPLTRTDLVPSARVAQPTFMSPQSEYADWFAELPADDQREILGAERFEMYTAGVPLHMLINDRCELRPVDELKQLLGRFPEKMLAPKRYSRPGIALKESGMAALQDALDWSAVHPDKTPKDVFEAVSQYQGTGYAVINRVAAGLPLAIQGERERFAGLIRALDSAFVMRTRRPIVVYRGLSANLLKQRAKLRPGLIIRVPCYMSTSLDIKRAQEFAYARPEGGEALLELVVPKDVPVLAPTAFTGSLASEAEVILPRNVHIRITSIKETTIMGRRVPYIRAVLAAPE